MPVALGQLVLHVAHEAGDVDVRVFLEQQVGLEAVDLALAVGHDVVAGRGIVGSKRSAEAQGGTAPIGVVHRLVALLEEADGVRVFDRQRAHVPLQRGRHFRGPPVDVLGLGHHVALPGSARRVGGEVGGRLGTCLVGGRHRARGICRGGVVAVRQGVGLANALLLDPEHVYPPLQVVGQRALEVRLELLHADGVVRAGVQVVAGKVVVVGVGPAVGGVGDGRKAGIGVRVELVRKAVVSDVGRDLRAAVEVYVGIVRVVVVGGEREIDGPRPVAGQAVDVHEGRRTPSPGTRPPWPASRWP